MLKYLVLILIIIGLLIPFQALAFNIGEALKGPIVPCGRDENNNGKLDEWEECTLCDIFVMAKNIVNMLLAIVLIIAPIFILGGGVVILTSAGAPDRVTLGKKIITSAIIGLVIGMGAWTILGTFFNVVIKGQIGVSEVGPLYQIEKQRPWAWNEFQCK